MEYSKGLMEKIELLEKWIDIRDIKSNESKKIMDELIEVEQNVLFYTNQMIGMQSKLERLISDCDKANESIMEMNIEVDQEKQMEDIKKLNELMEADVITDGE